MLAFRVPVNGKSCIVPFLAGADVLSSRGVALGRSLPADRSCVSGFFVGFAMRTTAVFRLSCIALKEDLDSIIALTGPVAARQGSLLKERPVRWRERLLPKKLPLLLWQHTGPLAPRSIQLPYFFPEICLTQAPGFQPLRLRDQPEHAYMTVAAVLVCLLAVLSSAYHLTSSLLSLLLLLCLAFGQPPFKLVWPMAYGPCISVSASLLQQPQTGAAPSRSRTGPMIRLNVHLIRPFLFALSLCCTFQLGACAPSDPTR